MSTLTNLPGKIIYSLKIIVPQFVYKVKRINAIFVALLCVILKKDHSELTEWSRKLLYVIDAGKAVIFFQVSVPPKA